MNLQNNQKLGKCSKTIHEVVQFEILDVTVIKSQNSKMASLIKNGYLQLTSLDHYHEKQNSEDIEVINL